MHEPDRLGSLTAAQAWYTRSGPHTTVWLAPAANSSSVADERAIGWKNCRRQLGDAGADAAVLDAIETAMGALARVDRHGALIVADAGGVAVADLDHGPADDQCWFGPAPALAMALPELAARQPWVAAVVDRVGADVLVHDPEGGDAELHVDGQDWEIHKGRTGAWSGWGQLRYQRRAEQTWEDNAADAAALAAAEATRVGARAIVLTGDVRATRMLRDHLPNHLRDLAVTVEAGSRKNPDALERVAAAADGAVAGLVAAERHAALARLAEELGQVERAVQGVAAVCDALAERRVETLFLVENWADDRQIQVGDTPTVVAKRAARIEALGQQPSAVRLGDGLARAALAGGARVIVVPPADLDVEEGVAALLRYVGRGAAGSR